MIRLFALDVAASLRERKTWLAAAMFAYAVFTLPLLLTKPPPHVTQALTAWFGSHDPFVLFMYLWTDLAMNKLIAVVAVVIGGGVILRERDNGVLPILASKPLRLPHYFLLRAGSACAVMAILYIGGHLLGASFLRPFVEGFRVGPYFASMAVHMWTAVFATALSATVGVVVGRRGVGALTSVLVLFVLVGMSFIGFYNPAWSRVALVNPFSMGVQVLAHLDSLSVGVVLLPVLALMVGTALTLLVGVGAVARMEARA